VRSRSNGLAAAALAVLCLSGGFALAEAARPPVKARRPHASHTQRKSRAAHKKKARKRPPLLTQDASGRVFLDRFETPTALVYGPFPLGEPQVYPEAPCEAVDTVVDVRLHEADAYTPEGQTAEAETEVSRKEQAPAGSLARIARELGSLFRPKSSAASVRPQDVDLEDLLAQGFRIPVEGVDVERLRDSFLSSRGRHAKHLAIDIGSPRGTPVLATTDGEIVRVCRERKGGRAIYQKDATGQYLLFYCHLSRYADGLKPGQKVAKGDVIGYVGSTGHVIGGPHLHFSITRLPQDTDNFKRGLAINPYLLFLAEVP
jgi:peptidoglycan LD-endopeptidase LytH